MGGVDFGTGSENKADKKGFPEQLNLKAAKDLDKPLRYLEHSKEEAEEIAHLYEINCKEGKSEFQNGKAATEAVMKILDLPSKNWYII